MKMMFGLPGGSAARPGPASIRTATATRQIRNDLAAMDMSTPLSCRLPCPSRKQQEMTSGDDLPDHACRLDAGQTHVQALELVRQLRVIQTEQVQNGGMQVADVDPVLNGV